MLHVSNHEVIMNILKNIATLRGYSEIKNVYSGNLLFSGDYLAANKLQFPKLASKASLYELYLVGDEKDKHEYFIVISEENPKKEIGYPDGVKYLSHLIHNLAENPIRPQITIFTNYVYKQQKNAFKYMDKLFDVPYRICSISEFCGFGSKTGICGMAHGYHFVEEYNLHLYPPIASDGDIMMKALNAVAGDVIRYFEFVHDVSTHRIPQYVLVKFTEKNATDPYLPHRIFNVTKLTRREVIFTNIM